jgi:hypothetical protein
MKDKQQRYVVFLNGNSRMGSSPDVGFCNEDELKNFNLYAEYIDVYPVGDILSREQKEKIGMKFSN